MTNDQPIVRRWSLVIRRPVVYRAKRLIAACYAHDKARSSMLTRRHFLTGAGMAAGGWLIDFLLDGLKARAPALLRPPGAQSEPDFLAACIRCGLCVEACPYDTLRLADATAGLTIGTPYLIARQIPCYLCQGYDELKCIAACPTAALQPVAAVADVRLGTATINHDTCLAWQGTPCRACWHACPFPDEAITLDGRGRAVVVPEKCVGCGLCDHACLTEPSSIVVRPQSQV